MASMLSSCMDGSKQGKNSSVLSVQLRSSALFFLSSLVRSERNIHQQEKAASVLRPIGLRQSKCAHTAEKADTGGVLWHQTKNCRNLILAMSDHEQSHPLNDSLAKPAAHRSNKLRISTTATAEMDNDMNKPADGLALPKIAKDSAPLTPASPRTDNENDDGSLPWSQWNSDKSSTEAYHTAPNSATSNSFPASPSSPAHSSTFRSGSGRSHRARSISSLQAFRRPSNAAAPATPSTSSVSNKIKGFISRDKSDKQTESKAAADSDDPLDQLINGDKTIHMTLTPKSIINLDKVNKSYIPLFIVFLSI